VTTAREIVEQAHRDAGALGLGQTLNAANVQEGFKRLNQMIGGWRAKRWMVFHLVELSVVCDGSPFYTIGSGGDFNVPVPPPKIEAAFVRQVVGVQNVDWPLTIIGSREEYSRIGIKTIENFPSQLFYDTAWPLGKVYLYPVPDVPYQVHIVVRDVLGAFPSLDSVLTLPPEYEEAMRMQLARRIAPTFGKKLDPEYLRLAGAAMDNVVTSNLQIAQLNLPREVTGGGGYNVFTNRVG
jgi:hypothetical protein